MCNFKHSEASNRCNNYRAVARLIVLVAKGSPKTAPMRLMTFRTGNLDI